MSTLLSADLPPADDALPDEAQEICRAIGDIHADLVARVARDALDPVRNAAAAAASAHAGILEKSGLADPEAPPAWPGRAIVRYRAAVMARVLGPLLDVLDEVEPGATTGAAWEEARARLRSVVEAASEEIVGPEPAGLFRYRPEDSPPLRWRKAAVRLGRAAASLAADVASAARRRAGRTVPTPEARVQRVPLRDLVAHHIDLRLPPLQLRLIESMAAHLGETVARLHRGVDPWVRAVLDAEVGTDRPGLHRGDEESTESPAAGALAHVDSVRAAADALHAALEEIAAGHGGADAVSTNLETIIAAEGDLVADIEVADSPLARPRPAAARASRALRGLDRRLDLWFDWHRRSRQALRNADVTLAIRAATHALLRGANSDVENASRGLAARLGATARTLRAERADLARTCDGCIDGADGESMLAALEQVAAHLPDIVEDDAVAPLRAEGPHRDLEALIDQRLGTLQTLIAELPEEVTVQARATLGSPPAPDTGAQRDRPRARFAESFDVVRLEAVRTAAAEAGRMFDGAIDEAAQARGVIEFNLHAAVAELRPADGAPPAAGALHDARELALNGLDRAAENLERIAAEAAARPRPFAESAFDAIHGGWLEVAARMRAEDTVQEHVLDVGYRVRTRVRERSSRVLAAARAWTRAGRRWSGHGVRYADRLRHLGRVAVEGERMTDEDRRRTLEALADADRLVEELPLVYRRLFGLQVVTDRIALEGRAAELDAVRRHYANWRSGITDALIVSGFAGGGAASFFDAALGVITGEGAAVARVTFDARTDDEALVSQRLATALGIGDDAPATFDGLAEHILSDVDRVWPAVALEGLEMLLLRTSADNGLLGPLLSLLSATDARVFWIARIARAAWSYIERAEPTAAGLVRHLPLCALPRADIESVILGRHARSGLPLVFEAPDPPSTLLRRRLRRATNEAERQAVLRTEFFDRLTRATGPSIVLALFYWLRCAHLEDGGDRLCVRPLEPLGFSFLSTLGFDHVFALKAFLEHGTLSIREHDRVVSVSRSESREIFASLANLLLIEPAADPAGPLSAHRDDVPWRLRPLVLYPVLTLLRARNLSA